MDVDRTDVEETGGDETELGLGSVEELMGGIRATALGPGPLGHETFTTTSPEWWPGGRTFGGMVVAQALHAATLTVPDTLPLHSLHAYFLRPSLPGVPSVHTVEHVRDGRSFSTRAVVTEAQGKEVFRMMCSFHQDEEGEEYQLPLAAGVAPPEEIPKVEGLFPFDVREVGASERRADGSFESTRRCWVKSRQPLSADSSMHACLLAYLSDMTGASFRPLSMTEWGTHTDASLDHALWFHRPARVDEWHLFDFQAVANAGGRATVRATMHSEAGELRMSMAQELLIRRLEVPMVFDVPEWATRVAERSGDPDDRHASSHGNGNGNGSGHGSGPNLGER